MKAGMSTTTTAKARRMPWTMVSPFMAPRSCGRHARAEPAASSHEASTRRSSAAPREALTSTTSPSRESGQKRVEGPVTVRHERRHRAACQAGLEGALARSRPRPRPRRRAVGRCRRACGPHAAMLAARGFAQLEHLAEDGDAPSRAAQRAGRGPPRRRPETRCRSRRGSSRRRLDELRAMRHGHVAREADGDLLGRQAGAGRHGGGGERVVDAVPAERGRRRPRRGPPGRQSRKRMPVGAARARRPPRRTSALGREAIGRGPARGVCAAIAATRASSALRMAQPSGGQRLDELALARLDGLDGAGAREMHAAHRGDDADGRAAPVGQERDLTRSCRGPSRARPPRARGAGAAASAAGRSRCSRCRRCAAPRKRSARTSAASSFVEVLASEPVMPTTSGSKRSR